MTKGEIGLNSFRNLCHLLCQIPLYFGLECYMSCLQIMFYHTFSIKINLLVSLQLVEKWLIWLCKFLVCYYLSLLWVTRLGTTLLPISWQKGGVGYGKGSCNLLVQMCIFGENSHWEGVTLWGGALHFSFIAYML